MVAGAAEALSPRTTFFIRSSFFAYVSANAHLGSVDISRRSGWIVATGCIALAVMVFDASVSRRHQTRCGIIHACITTATMFPAVVFHFIVHTLT